MDVEKVKAEVSKRMSGERFAHVLRVVDTAIALAEKYAVSVRFAEQAALLHDIAKQMQQNSLQRIILREELDPRLLSFHPELWHAPVGAVIAREEFGITNEDVLNAIRYHTTGRAGMSNLEKVIYVADMIEPGRNFPGVERLRRNAGQPIDIAMEACIHHSVQFLIAKKVPVYPDSIDCYNEHAT